MTHEYVNSYRVQSTDGSSRMVRKEGVEKIGGNIPINVVVFDDGADVFSSVQVSVLTGDCELTSIAM